MKFDTPQTLASIAHLLSCEFVGESEFPITGLNEIHMVEEGDVVFVDHSKYYDKALQSAATTILIDKKVDCPTGKALIISDNPFADFNKLIDHFSAFEPSLHLIDQTVQIGEGTIIQPGVFIGPDVTIGSNCTIHANVTINGPAVIGNNVCIHSNATLGADAFYFQKKERSYHKFTSCGRVVIDDDVEIGANATIDKGVTGDTHIGKGTKIDNLVMIGHDCIIGENCLFAAQVGLAGTVVIEDDVVLWGQVGVATGLTIGKGAVVLAQSGIAGSLEGGKTYFGYPAGEARTKMKELAVLRQLPDIMRKLP